MAKYYVQSGTVRTVVSATDSRRAALWAVHKVMQQIVPTYDDSCDSPSEKACQAQAGGMFVLDSQIRLSEKGFDRDDCSSMETFEVVTEWNQLMVALDRLQDWL
ncbi:hypothetical protein FF011L_08040 [Roseimaritima multifibrata]|uniref:Uncharacterized protein n=1 Tax=Roseimaritima multifibrata TaxID=1930274 RepID=A0A517MB07_9BACT|nr:hypothetical protein [Roseimaritima multifibrata]QDS92068.1 hypothetical protein FF011L_08040 [Roseimaritima multifibrata]